MKEKKSNGIQLLLRMVVKAQDGKVLSDTGHNPAKSFVIKFLQTVYGMFDGVEHGSYAHTRQVGQQMRMDAAVGQDNRGIVVGTGTTPATNTDSSLETQLTEGVGAGNITHSEETFVATAVVSGNVDMVVKRPFTNNTGSTIAVAEVGIYLRNTYDGLTHLHVRDVLGASIDVPDKASLTVYYTWRTDVAL